MQLSMASAQNPQDGRSLFENLLVLFVRDAYLGVRFLTCAIQRNGVACWVWLGMLVVEEPDEHHVVWTTNNGGKTVFFSDLSQIHYSHRKAQILIILSILAFIMAFLTAITVMLVSFSPRCQPGGEKCSQMPTPHPTPYNFIRNVCAAVMWKHKPWQIE